MDGSCVDEVNSPFIARTVRESEKKTHYGSLSSNANNNLDWAASEESDKFRLTVSERVEPSRIQRRIWLNVALLTSGYFFLFMGVIPVGVIQSSWNSEQGLGVASMAIKSAFMVVGSFVAPSLIQLLGCKSAIILGSFLYVTYIPANFYPTWYTLVPFAILAGIGCTVAAVAHKVYLARLARLYSQLTGMEVDRINSRTFVILVCAVKLSWAVGNIASSYILGIDEFNPQPVDLTVADHRRLATCGINYCDQNLRPYQSLNETLLYDGTEVGRPEFARVYVLIGFCTVSGLVSVVCFSFLRSFKDFGITSIAERLDSSPLSAFTGLLRAMRDPRHLLFIPLAIVLNGGDSFWVADFTKAFITCSLGMAYLGYVTVWSGLSGLVSCALFGWFNKKSVRSFPVFCATILQLLALVKLFYWIPSLSLLNNYWTLSIIGIVFFFGSGIRHFIAPVLVSVVFEEDLESAFAVFHFWTYFSSTLFYAWSNLVCVTFKVYFLMAMLTLSFLGYVGVELLISRNHGNPRSVYKRLPAHKTNQ